MIDYLNGILEKKTQNEIIVDANGIGYKIAVPNLTFSNLPPAGSEVKIYIVEAPVGMYGGLINLYGFLTCEERDMYLLIKENVPSTGAKKAIEYEDKISKSFAQFKTAISTKNVDVLVSKFGFTKKTADKLISSLKEKIISVDIKNNDDNVFTQSNAIVLDAVMALKSLGIKENQAKLAVSKAFEDDENIALEGLIKKSLKFIG